MRRMAAALLALLLLASWLGASRAHASIEEFDSFDLSRMEEDDESALDHYLARQPVAWRDEWERSTNGFRTSQGCLTAGLWNTEYETKVRSPMGEKTHLDLELLQVETDYAHYQWLSLDFRYRSRAGNLGFRFRPSYDKSQQDFAFLWSHGDGTTPLQVETALTIEDMFNTFWEFRQARVKEHNEPYRRHPFEPSARVISRGKKHRLELGGTWQTPSRKVIDDPDSTKDGAFTLWGSKFLVVGERQFSDWNIEARLDGERVLTTRPTRREPGNARLFRRMWNGELAIRRQLGADTRAELRWMYKDRAQSWAPPGGDGRLRALDRVLASEISHGFLEHWNARAGLMYDRVTIAVHGAAPGFTWGSRKESRAYLGLRAKFGRVSVQGIECIELDHEPYEVSFHHDKGFLHLQTTF